MSIGVGISTQDRRVFLMQCIQQVAKLTPEDAVIVVCDDHSIDDSMPHLEAWVEAEGDKRIELIKHQCVEGIAVTKSDLLNRVLSHPEVTDVFLMEDDLFPVKESWYQIFIDTAFEHSQAHLLFMPTEKKYGLTLRTDDGTNPIQWKQYCSGMLMYWRRKLVEEIGGFDSGFRRYGYEHNEMTSRSLVAEFMCPTLYPHCLRAERDATLFSRDVEGERLNKMVPSSTDMMAKQKLARDNEAHYRKLMAKYINEYREIQARPRAEMDAKRKEFYFG